MTELNFSERIKMALDIIEDDTSLKSGNWLDPRAMDMPKDSNHWSELMRLVHQSNQKDLINLLNDIRGVGSKLVSGHRAFLIQPVIDPDGERGWTSQNEFNEYMKLMQPYQSALDALLLKMHYRCGGR